MIMGFSILLWVVLTGMALGQTVYFEPSEVTVSKAGESFSVELKVRDVQDLYGFEASFSFDKTALSLKSVDEGDFLKSDGGQTFKTTTKDADGDLNGAAVTRLLEEKGLDGEGTLLVLTFEVSEPKEGKVEVSVKLSDSNAQEIKVAKVTSLIVKVPAPENQPPVAVAGENLTVKVGEEISLDGGGSSDPDGQIVSYEWDFGDGTKAKGAQVKKIYDTPGEYQVILKVTDDKGATATATLVVTVMEKGKAVITEHAEGSPMLALQAKFPTANTLGKAYIEIWKGTFEVKEGMYLEYQIYMPSGNPHFKAAVEVHTSDGTILSAITDPKPVDQNDVSAAPSTDLSKTARDKWYHRKISLDALAGKTIDAIMLASESSEHKPGLFRAYVDNVQITDGNVRLLDVYIDDDNVPATGQPESTLSEIIPSEGVEDAKVSVEKVVAVEPTGKMVTSWAEIKELR
jgi:PKD repeat protein